jgi:hypothetical protein
MAQELLQGDIRSFLLGQADLPPPHVLVYRGAQVVCSNCKNHFSKQGIHLVGASSDGNDDEDYRFSQGAAKNPGLNPGVNFQKIIEPRLNGFTYLGSRIIIILARDLLFDSILILINEHLHGTLWWYQKGVRRDASPGTSGN